MTAHESTNAHGDAHAAALRRSRTGQPADWMRLGAPVNYHAVIGGPVVLETTITGEPWLLGGHTWVVALAGKSGCVSCGAITPREVAP